MKQSQASRRINEQAREVIANILLFDMSDPRLAQVTITACEVSFDRSACNVYYTTDQANYESCAEALNQASGRIRTLMAQRLSWRVAPELRFKLDKTVDAAATVDAVLKRDKDRYANCEDDFDDTLDDFSPDDNDFPDDAEE